MQDVSLTARDNFFIVLIADKRRISGWYRLDNKEESEVRFMMVIRQIRYNPPM